MNSRHALVPRSRSSSPAGRGGIDPRAIAVLDLMPPEEHYRPARVFDGTVVGTFFIVFATVFALLWLSASIVPVFIVVTIYFARVFAQRASHASAVQQNQAAVQLLNSGRVEEAARIFDRLTQTERKTPAHAVYVFNRAVAYMLQGRPRRAYSLFNAVLRSHSFHFGSSNIYLPLLYAEMATCLALMGSFAEAARVRDEASKVLPPHEDGRLVFLDTLLLVRLGHHTAADELAGRCWRQAEALLRPPTLKGLRLLHAFSLKSLGRHHTPKYSSLIQSVGPVERGEFDWIGAEWPEFRAFVDSIF